MIKRRAFVKNLAMMGAFPFIDRSLLKEMQLDKTWFVEDGKDYGSVIEAPENKADWPAFRMELQQWRERKRKELNYTGDTYDDASFHWASSNFACCFLMMYDLNFYDAAKKTYTVDKIIERGKKEFGGYDSVVLWHAYPRIGIDERNQFDFYRDMPGGIDGVKKVTDEFHKNNIRVFINYNPWDTGTRRESKSDIDLLVEMVAGIGADGIFLDTMKKAGDNFREKLNGIKPGIVLEGELAAELDILPVHHLSWAQWFEDKYVPGILRNKWYERRHIQHQIARWNRDHTQELQQAWMNGSGMMIWENVFGQWIAWSERDKSVLRTMLPIQRRYHDHFTGENWMPLVATEIEGVFASLWQANNIKLWTLVNRHEHAVSGILLHVDHAVGDFYYDLVAGELITFKTNDGAALLNGTIAPRSIGCFIAGKRENFGSGFESFLSAMKLIRNGYKNETGFPVMAPMFKKNSLSASDKKMEKDMVELKPVTINQRFQFSNRECGTYASYPIVSMDELGKMLHFERAVHIPHIAVDITPVTNRAYSDFIKQSGYHPAERHNFLKHWQDDYPPAGKENHPVVYVDLQDARAYARWAGKRLPTEGEWQFAAQGFDQLAYPWGNELKENCYNKTGATTPINTFPEGASPFGCLDMCGSIWQMTESEHADHYNRFCILKGGAYFEAKGSFWYTSGGPQPSSLATKFLMLYPGLDRCATIGFRCVKDLQ